MIFFISSRVSWRFDNFGAFEETFLNFWEAYRSNCLGFWIKRKKVISTTIDVTRWNKWKFDRSTYNVYVSYSYVGTYWDYWVYTGRKKIVLQDCSRPRSFTEYGIYSLKSVIFNRCLANCRVEFEIELKKYRYLVIYLREYKIFEIFVKIFSLGYPQVKDVEQNLEIYQKCISCWSWCWCVIWHFCGLVMSRSWRGKF